MLIVCSGPDSFRAKQKLRGFVASFKEKYDKTGKSIETINDGAAYQEVVSRLSSPSLFNPKSMLVCSGLLDGLKVAQLKTLAKALLADADQNVVVDYEEKKLTQKNSEYFTEKTLLAYVHEELEGANLRKEIGSMCQKYGVDPKNADKLISAFGNDLWAADAALQMASAGAEISDFGEQKEGNLFQLAEDILTDNKKWLSDAVYVDKDDLLNVLISQIRSWYQVQAGATQGVHPYVQKKMSSLRVKDPNEKALSALRALYAARNSLAQGRETETII